MKISDAEKEVMGCLWHEAPQTAREIASQLTQKQDWHEKTVKTLINRLLKKDAISFEKRGREYCYSPLISQDDYQQTTTRQFLDRMFDGRISALVAAFAQAEKLSSSDIEELKILLQELKDDQ